MSQWDLTVPSALDFPMFFLSAQSSAFIQPEELEDLCPLGLLWFGLVDQKCLIFPSSKKLKQHFYFTIIILSQKITPSIYAHALESECLCVFVCIVSHLFFCPGSPVLIYFIISRIS